MIRLSAFVFVTFLLTLSTVAASAADLTITVKDVRNASGSVLIAVYDSEGSFMKPEVAKAKQKTKASPGEVEFILRDLPAGKYAVSVFHDENGNGKLDRNLFGVPKEGHGFSNDALCHAGPPKFSQAAFDFDGKTGKTITFPLHY
jgi:uncharacterized protein (DUF2141 family)